MRAAACVLICLSLLLGTVARAAPLDDVMEADRAFARHAAAHGAQAAFTAFAAADAILFRNGSGPVQGREAIGALFARTRAVPQWAPEGGAVAASNDLAWTWGPYRWTLPDPAAPPITGYYVTIWQRIDGRWLWVGDRGVAAPVERSAALLPPPPPLPR